MRKISLLCILLGMLSGCDFEIQMGVDDGNSNGECTQDGGCNNGEKCDDGVCVKECTLDTQCLNGLKCSDTRNVCVCGNEKCNDNQHCCSDKCVDLTTDTNHCGTCETNCEVTGQVCDNSKCVDKNNEPECTENQKECDGNNVKVCMDGAWQTTECKAGEVCENEKCITKGSECTSIVCNNGEKCEEGVCVKECASDKQCNDNQHCCSDKCVDLTTDRKHCGECETNCEVTGQVCENSECVAGTSCTTSANCLGGQICEDGLCIVKSCTDNDSCGSGYTCCNKVCVNLNSDPANCYTCGYTCSTSAVGNSCVSSLCTKCTQNDDCKYNAVLYNHKAICSKQVCAFPYPKRKSIKGLRTDGYSINTIVEANVHNVAIDIRWDQWESEQPPSNYKCNGTALMRGGHCYTIDENIEKAIKEYTAKGVVVTANIFGVPKWARKDSSDNNIDSEYCAINNGAGKVAGIEAFPYFVGFLAERYNGILGHGRISDFVIHREANNTELFNKNCKNKETGSNQKVNAQAQAYVNSYNAAYNEIIARQPTARVLVPINVTETGESIFDAIEFLNEFKTKASPGWRVALHAYTENDKVDETFRDIASFIGELHSIYGKNHPQATEVYITEFGINLPNNPNLNDPDKTNSAICSMFQNALGTPGIETLIYHRSVNQNEDAWNAFEAANKIGILACGFENLPFTILTRWFDCEQGVHLATTRTIESNNSRPEQAWKLLREPVENTELLYECLVDNKYSTVSKNPKCSDLGENAIPRGPLGYAYKSSKVSEYTNNSQMYRCNYVGEYYEDSLISSLSNCEGEYTVDQGFKGVYAHYAGQISSKECPNSKAQ